MLFALLALFASLAACAGKLQTSDVHAQTSPGPGAKPHNPSFACGENVELLPSSLRRLSRDQYLNSLHDLLAAQLAGDQLEAAWNALSPVLDGVPADMVTKHAPFGTMDQAVSEQHIDSYLAVAQAVGNELTASPARIKALLACKPSTAERACIEGFIRRFGRLAFRHPLTPAEFAFLREVYPRHEASAGALRELIALMLTAPQFLYQVEIDGAPVKGEPGVYALGPYELASRLALHLWQTSPDDALLSAAAAGELNSDEGYARVVDRMLKDPRAERSMHQFVNEWFDLTKLRPLDTLVGDPVFDAFAGDDLPSPDLREAMQAEVLDSFVYHMRRGDAYKDWFLSPYSFAESDELAKLYAVAAWDGAGEPPRFPAGQRAGLLTRAAVLATGSANTRPIMKGVFIRERLLCDGLPPPPANAANVPPELSRKMTTREVVEALTEQPNTSCASCHHYQINALGFATEGYDALGRVRKEQRLFTAEGAEVGRKPINTAGVPRIWLDDARTANGPSELANLIVESGKGEACFARQVVRFTYGRVEDPKRDGCVLEDIRAALDQPRGLERAFKAPLMHPTFRQRRVDVTQ